MRCHNLRNIVFFTMNMVSKVCGREEYKMSDERKKRWIVTLDVDHAGEGLLESKELFDEGFQRKNLARMIWGMGDTEEEALRNTVENLTGEDILHVSLSEPDLCDFIAKHGGREAVRNSWFDENGDPHLLAGHDALADFCERYNLPKEARKELAAFFDAFLFTDEDMPAKYIPNSPDRG